VFEKEQHLMDQRSLAAARSSVGPSLSSFIKGSGSYRWAFFVFLLGWPNGEKSPSKEKKSI